MSEQTTAHATGDRFLVSKGELVSAIEAQLKESLSDEFGPTHGRFEIDYIIGGILLKLRSAGEGR